MKLTFFSLLVLWGSSPVPALSAKEVNRVETKHLVIEWNEGTLGAEVEAAETEGERFYSAVRDMIGFEPKGKIVLLLEGSAEQPNGEWSYPHVDSEGRVHLFRFEASGRSYFNSLAHELVHAFRFDRRRQAGLSPASQYATVDWFFEEGFAEFVALRVDSSLGGFPWYDFPVTVVAGQWVANGDDIPLEQLRDRHAALNQPCQAQAYSLRSAFFDYLGKTYGDDAVLRMADLSAAGNVTDYPKFFKKEFAALEAEWRMSLLQKYKNTEDVQELARRYRQETAVKYQHVCKKGVEF